MSSHVTFADLLSHRSGLPEHAGDDLEALGYDRTYVLRHLRDLPLNAFRSSYAYTNFGFTEAAVAAARAKRMTWEDLAATELYRPLGMTSTSSRYSDYEHAGDKAVGHVRGPGNTWQARYVRDPDPQAPAGGVSSTARDMAQWVRLQLAGGELDGKRIVDPNALAETHLPRTLSNPPSAPAGRAGFYGLGWNVTYDDAGRLVLGHSGAFTTGASTDVELLPSEQLGIVVLANGAPIGVPETITQSFLDLARYGSLTVDWPPLIEKAMKGIASDPGPDRSKPPASPTPAAPATAYLGTYANGYFGPLTVTPTGGRFRMHLGHQTFTLTHYDANTFTFPSRPRWPQ